jgi:hypothetical protein
MDSASDLDNFAVRLCAADPMRLVTKVHTVAPFDLRDVHDLDPYEVGAGDFAGARALA